MKLSNSIDFYGRIQVLKESGTFIGHGNQYLFRMRKRFTINYNFEKVHIIRHEFFPNDIM